MGQRCVSKNRSKREACKECGKKTLSHYKPFVSLSGNITPAEDICRSCKSIFIKGIKLEVKQKEPKGEK